MDREELEKYISEIYSVDADFPWAKYPNCGVFRHSGNRKWFALIMDVTKDKLGLAGEGAMDILNVKCEPVMIDSLRSEPGIYPAYHMNKASWVSVALDGSAGDDKIKMLLEMSFDLTAEKARRRSPKPKD